MSVFRATAAAIAEQVSRHVEGRLPLAKASDPRTDEIIDRAIAGLDFSALAALKDDFEDVLADLALHGARQAMAAVRVKVPTAEAFTLPNDQIRAWAKLHAAELVGKRVLEDGTVIDNPNPTYAISEATRTMIRGAIEEAFDGDGLTRPELAAKLEDTFAFSEERAELIARTEIGRALVEGNVAAWRESGVVGGKEWILGDLHDLDDDCDRNAQAGVIPLEATFPSGDAWPPAHPNCTCDVVPHVEEP